MGSTPSSLASLGCGMPCSYKPETRKLTVNQLLRKHFIVFGDVLMNPSRGTHLVWTRADGLIASGIPRPSRLHLFHCQNRRFPRQRAVRPGRDLKRTTHTYALSYCISLYAHSSKLATANLIDMCVRWTAQSTATWPAVARYGKRCGATRYVPREGSRD